MPLKRAVMKHCALSPAAACIGCVNTLSLQLCSSSKHHCANGESVQIVGDNTDWAGMLACLSAHYRLVQHSDTHHLRSHYWQRGYGAFCRICPPPSALHNTHIRLQPYA